MSASAQEATGSPVSWALREVSVLEPKAAGPEVEHGDTAAGIPGWPAV